MKSIAITGTIGSGKSACSQILRELGYSVFDCDRVCHQYLEKDGILVSRVIELLGSSILNEDGSVSRSQIAKIVFDDFQLKKQYEKMFHTELKKQIQNEIQASEELFFAEVPLLYETGFDALFDEVWLITCDEEIAVERCMKNRNMTKQQVFARIKTQMSTEEKIQRADIIFENNHELDDLRKQVVERIKELNHSGILRKESVSD